MEPEFLPFGGFQDVEQLEASHRSFSGLIDLALRTGAHPGEIEGYRECQRGIEVQIRRLKAAKPPGT